MEKKFESLNKFCNRNYRLYVSDNNDYELLIFDYRSGDNTHFLRYPKTEYFVEIFGGMKCGCGTKNQFNGSNIWKNTEYENKITIYCDNSQICLVNNNFDFYFMRLVGDSNSADRMNRAYLDAKCGNVEYLKLPTDVSGLSYLMKTIEDNPTYIVVDYPKYNFKYDNQRFRIVKDNVVTEHKIINFERFKDGGTTYITTIDESGDKHEFFSPTSLRTNIKYPTYDKIFLDENIDELEKEIIIKLLDIELAPIFKNN